MNGRGAAVTMRARKNNSHLPRSDGAQQRATYSPVREEHNLRQVKLCPSRSPTKLGAALLMSGAVMTIFNFIVPSASKWKIQKNGKNLLRREHADFVGNSNTSFDQRWSPNQEYGKVHNNHDDDGEECSVYLAQSSVSDANDRPAGFGVFTTKQLQRGSYIFPKGQGPSVVITDIVANNFNKRPSWANSIFMPPAVGFDAEADDPGVFDPKVDNYINSMKANVNVGSLTNFHPYLINVEMDDNGVYKDNILDRFMDPGAGAFTYHMGEKWYTTRDVEAGEEMFNNYGEKWFFDSKLKKESHNIPHKVHYKQASVYIQSLLQRLAEEGKTHVEQEHLDKLHEVILAHSERRISMLVPRNATEMSKLVSSLSRMSKEASNFEKEKNEIAMALSRNTLLPNRDIAWIKRNGRCLDNIRPGISTIRQAGQGAFAMRDVPSGDVVVPVPTMLQITNRAQLDIYQHKLDVDQRGIMPVGDEAVTKQLLLNYCIGHENSSLLLCPATNANLINHCSNRSGWAQEESLGQCDPSRGPNAVLRWATEFDPDTKEWLGLSLREIENRVKKERRGLSFEVVATRNIRKGDEIFIDYGTAWEKAWSTHVSGWKPPTSGTRLGISGASAVPFVPIETMNQDIDGYLQTEGERQRNPYPHPKVRVGCFDHAFYHPCEILERLKATEPAEASAKAADGGNLEGKLDRRPMYKARLNKWLLAEINIEFGYKWRHPVDSVEIELSSRHVRFFVGEYTSDQHLPGTFRQHIGVPDGMWPKHWLNLAGENVPER